MNNTTNNNKYNFLIGYLTAQQKGKITKLYKRGMKVNKIAKAVNEPNLVVKQYLENTLGIEIEQKYCYEVHGHLQLNDFYNSYLHQYVVSKELGISIMTVKSYCVHHINGDKMDNNISNLWLFADGLMHIKYHSLLEVGKIKNDLDSLYIFSMEYCINCLNEIQKRQTKDKKTLKNYRQYNEMKQQIHSYMELMMKLYKKQKKILLQLGEL